MQVALQPIDAFLREFNIESGAAHTLFNQQSNVEEATSIGDEPQSPVSSTSSRAPVPLMGIITRPVDREVEIWNEYATPRIPGQPPSKRPSTETAPKRNVQVSDFPGQTVFNGLSMKDREETWNIFDYVMWATFKHATDEELPFKSWRKYRSSEVYKFQEGNMSNSCPIIMSSPTFATRRQSSKYPFIWSRKIRIQPNHG